MNFMPSFIGFNFEFSILRNFFGTFVIYLIEVSNFVL